MQALAKWPFRACGYGRADRTALAPESGFTLVETLVMLAVSALIAALVIPLSGQGVRDNFRLADRALLSGDYSSSETHYRLLLRQAAPPLMQADGSIDDASLVGISTSLRFPVESEQAEPCSGVAGYAVVRLLVERKAKGGRLVCDSAGGSYQLLEWSGGEASFSYSGDGAEWFETWPIRTKGVLFDPGEPPLVRLSLRQGRRTRLLWVERAGDRALHGKALAGRPSGTPFSRNRRP
jgi:type II secretory pathway pseudopilin PulG